jgi:hypothetical protein
MLAPRILEKQRLSADLTLEQTHEKTPGAGCAGGYIGPAIRPGKYRLLDLGFLELHVLAHHRVVFVQLQLLRLRTRILFGHIKVTSIRGGNELDLNDVGFGHEKSP